MSIQIQNDSLAGMLAPGLGRADQISSPASSPSQSTTKSGNRGGDNVEISSLSQSVTAASTVQDAQHASRIKALTALYRSGQYNIDSAQVSRAIVSQALGDGAGEMN